MHLDIEIKEQKVPILFGQISMRIWTHVKTSPT